MAAPRQEGATTCVDQSIFQTDFFERRRFVCRAYRSKPGRRIPGFSSGFHGRHRPAIARCYCSSERFARHRLDDHAHQQLRGVEHAQPGDVEQVNHHQDPGLHPVRPGHARHIVQHRLQRRVSGRNAHPGRDLQRGKSDGNRTCWRRPVRQRHDSGWQWRCRRQQWHHQWWRRDCRKQLRFHWCQPGWRRDAHQQRFNRWRNRYRWRHGQQHGWRQPERHQQCAHQQCRSHDPGRQQHPGFRRRRCLSEQCRQRLDPHQPRHDPGWLQRNGGRQRRCRCSGDWRHNHQPRYIDRRQPGRCHSHRCCLFDCRCHQQRHHPGWCRCGRCHPARWIGRLGHPRTSGRLDDCR